MLFAVLGGGVYSHVVCCTWLVAEYIAMTSPGATDAAVLRGGVDGQDAHP